MSEITVRGPKGCAKSLSYDGVGYTADKKGVFTVPSEAWEHLQRHGFKVEGQDEVVVETDEERATREAAEAVKAEAERKAAEEAAKAAGGAQP